MDNSQWISVKDRLPEVGEKVLVVTSNGSYTCCSTYIPKDCYGTVIGKKRWKGSGSFVESITHWMAIPKLKND